MGAGVRVDDVAFFDVRFDYLARLAKLADADHARGKVERLWLACTQRGTYVLPEAMVDSVVSADALVAAELAERVDGGVRLRGTVGRTEWYTQAVEHGRRGAAKRWGPDGDPSRPPIGGPNAQPPHPRGGERGGSARKGGSQRQIRSQSESQSKRREGELEGEGRGPEMARVVARYVELFGEQSGGARPRLTARETSLVGQLVALPGGADEVVRRMENMFQAPPAWPPPPHDLRTLHQHFDRFATAHHGPKNGAPRDRGAELLAKARELEEQGL